MVSLQQILSDFKSKSTKGLLCLIREKKTVNMACEQTQRPKHSRSCWQNL